MIRLLLALCALPLLGACAGGGPASGDIYALRLAVENLQEYETDTAESVNAQLRALRANQDQVQLNLERRLDTLEVKIIRLEELVARLAAQGGTGLADEQVAPRRVLALPPDPETQRRGPSPERVDTEPPTLRPPVTNPYAVQEPINPPQ